MSSPPGAARAAIAGERSSAAQTLGSLVVRAAERRGTALLSVNRAASQAMSYAELGGVVREIAGGLVALGIAPKDRVAIISNTRAEWTLADLGALCAGARPTRPSSVRVRARCL